MTDLPERLALQPAPRRGYGGIDANLPASRHSPAECTAAFEWLRELATKDGAIQHAGVVLDEWHALSTRTALEADIRHARALRALVVVGGGVADVVADDGVDVTVFDWDNYRADPKSTDRVPARLADLAYHADAPVEKIAGLDVGHAGRDASEENPVRYTGVIRVVDTNFVVQDLGREQGVIHLVDKLEQVPSVGKNYSITYIGAAQPAVVTERTISRGKER